MIDITFRYTLSEYRDAVRAKLLSIKRMRFHLVWPFFLFAFLAILTWGVLQQPWWAVTASVLVGAYASLGVLMIWLVPVIMARVHANGKLAKTYRFQINADGVHRSDEEDEGRTLAWDDIKTVDIAGTCYFIMIDKGAMLLPFGRLDAAQHAEFRALSGNKLRSGSWSLAEARPA